MKREFKLGMRVRVYIGGRRPIKGKVEAVTGENSIQVIEDGFYSVHADAPFHPRQLVRLKPRKPKPERMARRVWILQDSFSEIKNGHMVVLWDHQPMLSGEMELCEVLPGEITIDQEKLAKAWDEHVCPSSNGDHSVFVSRKSRSFQNFCDALGLSTQGEG